MNTIDPENLSALENALGSLVDPTSKMVFEQSVDTLNLEKAMIALESLVRNRFSETDTGHLGIYYDVAKKEALIKMTKNFILSNEVMIRSAVKIFKEQQGQ